MTMIIHVKLFSSTWSLPFGIVITSFYMDGSNTIPDYRSNHRKVLALASHYTKAWFQFLSRWNWYDRSVSMSDYNHNNNFYMWYVWLLRFFPSSVRSLYIITVFNYFIEMLAVGNATTDCLPYSYCVDLHYRLRWSKCIIDFLD